MERPDIGKPAVADEKRFRLVARTASIEEAERIARQFEMQGFDTKIVRNTQASLSVYEVWIGKAPEIFSGRGT